MKELHSTASIKGHPIHPMLVPIPITLFLAALVTDVVFAVEGSQGWAEASKWLIGGGIGGALIAALAGFADFLGNSAIRSYRDAWLHMFANLAAVVLEVVNFVLRLADENAAASGGLILSAVTALLLAFSGWKGGELVYRYGVGQIRSRQEQPGT